MFSSGEAMNTKGIARAVFTICLIAAQHFPGFGAPQLGLRLSPELWIPAGNHSSAEDADSSLELFSMGYGLTIVGDMSFMGFASPYLELGFSSIPFNNVASTSMAFTNLGTGLSFYYYPIPRLMVRAGAGGGIAYVSAPKTDLAEAIKGLAPYWKAKVELGYRFSPTFSVLGDVGYSQIVGTETSVYKGISLGAVANIGLDKLGGRTSSLVTSIDRQKTLFPVVYYKSEKTPIGYLKLTNGESAEIRDVRVSFGAGAYTSRDADCGSFLLINRGKSVELPIYANFNDKVLGFSELTKIQGEIKIEYKILNAAKESSVPVAVVFNNRNAVVWADERIVGAFVSPQDPAMLELSKYISGLTRVHARPELDKNLQYGMGLYEGLRVYGVVWTADPNLPYVVARKDKSRVAYIQYPYQSLSYKSGDSDSLAIMIAEALESVAVPAAVIPLPEEVLVAFPLDMTASKARSTFTNPDDLIFREDKAWVPLSVSQMRDGFLRAWKGGAELWHRHSADNPRFIEIEDAWKEYLPIALTDIDFKPIKPSEESVNLAFENVIGRFVTAEVGPKAKRLLDGMQGEGTGRQRNNLGILYAQYGLYKESKVEFEKAVAMDYNPAMINYANVCFLLQDYDNAAMYFKKALEAQPDNKVALIGLARARYELDDFAGADELFARVKSADPALAEQYAYLKSKVDVGNALRASASAADRKGAMKWDEEK
jgi:tetratricopeptide (TPR) repeat protein